MKNKFAEFYKDDLPYAYEIHCFVGVALGVLVFHAFLIYVCMSANDNKSLNDYEQDGLAANGKTPIENAIDKLQLADKIAEIEFPAHFICKAGNKLMLNPVFNMNGDSFDYDSYQDFLRTNSGRDPITNQVLNDTKLLPNLGLRKQILEFLETYAANLQRNSTGMAMLYNFSAWARRGLGVTPELGTAENVRVTSSNIRTPLLV